MTYSPRGRYSPIVVPNKWTPLTIGNIYTYSNFDSEATGFIPIWFWNIPSAIDQLASIIYSSSTGSIRMGIWTLDEDRLYRPRNLLAQTDVISLSGIDEGDAVVGSLLDADGDPIDSLQLETNNCAFSVSTDNDGYEIMTFDYGGQQQFVTGHPNNSPEEVTYYAGPAYYSGGYYLGANSNLIEGGYDVNDLLPLQLEDGDDDGYWWNNFYWNEYTPAMLIKGA